MENELSQSLTERELGTLKEFVENTLSKKRNSANGDVRQRKSKTTV